MIPLTKPTLNHQELKAVKQVLSSGWVTQGPKVTAFEKSFAAYVGAKNACAVSNCTAGLQLALLSVGVKPGDIVITVSHSFIATANCIRWCGAEPVFIDIDPETYNMAPNLLELFLQNKCRKRSSGTYYKKPEDLPTKFSPFKKIHRRTDGRIAAILAVHQMGMPCDIKHIVKIAKRFHLPVIEDAACAIGSEIKTERNGWERIGKPHGDIACFSFHPRKIITTGEGGMLTTNTSKYDRMFRLLRHHGMSVSDVKRNSSKKIVFEKYLTTAFNYRMTDIQAAVGLQQLLKLPSILKKRRQLADLYAKKLKSLNSIDIPKEGRHAKTNWQSYAIRICGKSPANRNKLMQHLLDNGISSRPGIMNSHQEAPYRSKLWKLPESENARDTVILLPLFPSMTRAQLMNVVSKLKAWR